MAVPAVIDLKDHKTAPSQVIDVGAIALRSAVGGWGDIAVVEDDSLEAAFWRLDKGNSQQAVNLVAFGDIADQVLVIVGSVRQLLFKGDLTPLDLQVAQIIDGEIFADFKNDFRGGRGRSDSVGV